MAQDVVLGLVDFKRFLLFSGSMEGLLANDIETERVEYDLMKIIVTATIAIVIGGLTVVCWGFSRIATDAVVVDLVIQPQCVFIDGSGKSDAAGSAEFTL